VKEVRDALESPTGADAAHLQPVPLGNEQPPEVIALKMADVQMLADATPWGDEQEGQQRPSRRE
jgi:hypothetical protein